MSEKIFVLIGDCWEDNIISTTEEDAIILSKKYPEYRVEIFQKSNLGRYYPTYNFFKNGVFIKSKN